MVKSTAVLSLVSSLVLLLAANTNAHSMMTNPRGRGNVEWWGTCASGAGCHGPCESPKSKSPILSPYTQPQTLSPGQKITVSWQRFNHPGGFVRLTMIPFEESDSWTAFNNAQSSLTVCYETNCGPDDPNNTVFGKLNGPGDGLCSTTFTVPNHLPEGKATLQWVWYGGGVYYAQPEASFGEYYTCADYKISGKPVGNSVDGSTKVWKGGDVSNPGKDVCKYWGSNKIGDCSFGNRKPPNPRPDDLLSQSLEPCSRSGQFVGKSAEFSAKKKKRVGRGIRSDDYVDEMSASWLVLNTTRLG